jgi:hypothetical protein
MKTTTSKTSVSAKVKKLAPNLARGFPRSPRATLGGYVLAGRAVDKCRADLAGTIGDYHFDCPLDNMFLGFAGLKGSDLRDFLATGADDKAVAQWIEQHAQKRPRVEIIKWNNDLRYKRISELPDKFQEFMEDYIPKNVPAALIPRLVYFFDIYDAEEKRIKA